MTLSKGSFITLSLMAKRKRRRGRQPSRNPSEPALMWLSRTDAAIKIGEYEVLLNRVGKLGYVVWTAIAWPLSLMLMDDTGGLAPSKRYRVSVQSAKSGSVLWREGAPDQAAFELAVEMAEQIQRIGIDDFLFKKEHGWRID